MRTHRFDAVSFLFGLLFLGVGGSVLVGDAPIWDLDARWVWPLGLIAAGLLLFGTVMSNAAAERRRRKRKDADDLGGL